MWWKLGEIWADKDPKKKSYNRLTNLIKDVKPVFSRDEILEVYKAKLKYLSMDQTQYPHCNQYVLHAPSACEFCDKHPDWQEQRLNAYVEFTGNEPPLMSVWIGCPADILFNMQKNKWHGNQPSKESSNDNGKS